MGDEDSLAPAIFITDFSGCSYSASVVIYICPGCLHESSLLYSSSTQMDCCGEFCSICCGSYGSASIGAWCNPCRGGAAGCCRCCSGTLDDVEDYDKYLGQSEADDNTNVGAERRISHQHTGLQPTGQREMSAAPGNSQSEVQPPPDQSMLDSSRGDDPQFRLSQLPPALQAGSVRHAEHQSFPMGGRYLSDIASSGGTSQRNVEYSYGNGELAQSQVGRAP